MIGNLQCDCRSPQRDSAPSHSRRHQRVRWQDVDGRECAYPVWICEFYELSGQWQRASEDFFESFKNYDEAGSPQRISVLKYLVLANMLTGSEVNPFDSQETKPYSYQRVRALFHLMRCRYKNDPQITAMTDLVDAYQRREVHEAEKILKSMIIILNWALVPDVSKTIGLPSWMTRLYAAT